MRLPWKRALLVLVAMTIVVAVAFLWFERPFTSRIGPIVGTWETSNQTFRIRVDNHAEKPGFVSGAYYVFRSAPVGSDVWRDIMTFRHDDPVPIPRDQVHLVNDRIGFVFMGWMYAVTTDRGTTWSVWDSIRDLPKWECCNYGLIKDVRLQPDGTGTMTLNPIRDRSGEVPELRTKDFGRHWN